MNIRKYVQKNIYGTNIINNIITSPQNDKYLTASMPVPPPIFLGRENDLAKLDCLLQQHDHVIIQGLGGCGKTSLCQYYFTNKEVEYKHLAWVRIRNDLISDFVNQIMIDITYEDHDDMQRRFEKLIVAMNNRYEKTTLIVIDNFDYLSFSDLQNLLSLRMKILITSRGRGVYNNKFQIYSLDFLDELNCVRLFRSYYGEEVDRDNALHKVIIDFAKRHTLLIQMMAQIARIELWSIQDLLDKLQRNDQDISGFYFQHIVNEWSCGEEVAIQEVIHRLFNITVLSDDERLLLAIFALFDASPVQLIFLKQVLKRNSWRILTDLSDKGWLLGDRKQGFWLHPIVKDTIKKYHLIEYNDCVGIIHSVSSLLINLVDSETDMNHSLAQSYFPHIISLLQTYQNERSKEVAELFVACSKQLTKMGNFQQALVWQLEAVSIYEQDLSSSQHEVASSYHNVALIYHFMGRYVDALNSQLKAVEINEKILLPDDTDLASSYNTLAVIYKEDMNEYEIALEWQIKAVNIFEKNLPPDHCDLASAYHTLASVYRSMANYDNALKWQFRAISIFEKVLSAEHVDRASSYHNLALIYKDAGKYEDACLWQIKAINIYEKILPSDHPHLAVSYHALAIIYRVMGEYENALNYQLKAIGILPNHPHLGNFYNVLASIYQDMGNSDEALHWQLEALKIHKENVPSDHLQLTFDYNSLAFIYRAMGKYEEAIKWQIKDIEISEKVLSPDHPDLMASRNNLINIYKVMGKDS